MKTVKISDVSYALLKEILKNSRGGSSYPWLDLEVEKLAKAVYGLSYLKDIVKNGAPLSETVIISYATEMPMKLDFSSEGCGLTFYLAPRIEVD